MKGASSFAPRCRLRKGADFRRVLKKGMRVPGPMFLVVAAENGRDHDRLGLTVSRKVGGAVERNRSRRLLRESFRRGRPPSSVRRGLDLVVLAARALAGQNQGEVDREFAERLRRLERKLEQGRRQGPPPSDRGL